MRILTPIEANRLIADLEKKHKIQLKEGVRKKIIAYSGMLDKWIPPLFGLLTRKPDVNENEIYEHLNSNCLFEKYLKDSPHFFQKYLESRGVFPQSTASQQNLTETESKILNVLMTNGQNIANRDIIAKAIWGEEWLEKYSDWMIDTEIYNLRKRLKNVYKIVTVRNKGYKLIKKGVVATENSPEEKLTDSQKALLPHFFYIEYMNNPKNIRKTLYDLFKSLGKQIQKSLKTRFLRRSEIKILIINSYSADNVDAAKNWTRSLFKNKKVDIFFSHYDRRSIEIHQKRIDLIKANNIFTIFDDIKNTKLKPRSFDIVINDFRLNFNSNHSQNVSSVKNTKEILKTDGISLISVVVDARYESQRYGKDQEKAPVNKNKPWIFESVEKLPRFCFTVPYYKKLFKILGFKVIKEFDIEEGKKWLKHFKTNPDRGLTYRRFLLAK